MGCHYINTPYRALKLTWPTRIHATATRVFEESAPLASIVTYDFPERKGFGPVRVIWYDGGLQPPFPPEMAGEKITDDGVLYIGNKGKMLRSKILTPDRARKFANLPKKQRATLILRTYHDMSHQQIADVLGSSVGAVKANFFHALANLKKILGSEP